MFDWNNITPAGMVAAGIAIVILLILLQKWNKIRRRAKIEQLLDASAGTFDEPAQEAFADGDDYTKAEIMHMNILEAEPTRNRTLAGIVARAYLDELNNPAGEHDMATVVMRAGQFNNAVIGAGVLDLPQWQDYPAEMMDTTINTIQNKTIHDTVVNAMQTADTGSEAAHTALAAAVKWTNDRQNVHDSSVNNDLRNTLMQIRDPNVDTQRHLREIATEIARLRRTNGVSQQKLDRAEMTLQRALSGEYITTYEHNENDILAYVWNRSKFVANDSSTIKEAVIDAMADCVENGNLVCINGRCSRYLGALAGVDANPNLGVAATAEAYKNEAFNLVQKAVDDVLEDARSSSDRAIREAAEKYDKFEDGSDLVREKLAEKIDSVIGEYSDKLSPADLEYTRTAARAYALVDE